MVAIVGDGVVGLGGRDSRGGNSLAWVDPDGGSDGNSNNSLVGFSDPDEVALVGGQWHGSDNAQERAGGEHVLGVHFLCVLKVTGRS